MAAYDIQKHFKGLRVETGRRRGRSDPFATGFEDDSGDEPKPRGSRSQSKQSPPADKKPVAPAAPAKTSISSPYSAIEALRDRDSDDEFLDPPKRTDRRPSPAPSKLPQSRVTDGAGRRGSLDHGLQIKGLQSPGLQVNRAPRSAVAQAAGALAYLDDSDDEDRASPPRRTDRFPSPAPRKRSDPANPVQRSSTPKGSREPPKELGLSADVPSKDSVASPFAGTKYLQDSDSDGDEEAVASRKSSVEDASTAVPLPTSPAKKLLEVQRVDKPKQNGSGVSWRAFSAGRAEQRNAEIETLQTSLRQRGKSISFGTHAVTDDGNRVPVSATRELCGSGPAGRGGKAKSRGKSPPRRVEDTRPTEDELVDGGPVGVYDPTQYKTNPFTGES
jgi:hypothetical protein